MPVGGILLAHYVLLRRSVQVPDLYDSGGPYAAGAGWSLPGTAAWIAGAATFWLAGSIGATLPSLVVTITTYVVLERLNTRRTGAGRAAPNRPAP